VALILSRQGLPIIEPNDQLAKGAYVLSDTAGTADITLIGTGAETSVALGAQKLLSDKDVSARVVNMPSWELFEKTPSDYQETVFPSDGTPRLVVEAGIAMGWEKYLGGNGTAVTMNSYGASAPGGVVLRKFGFSAENVAEKALSLLKK
jgi:transketolase